MLRDHGHPQAGLYPIGVVRDEATIVRRRINADYVMTGLVLQAAKLSTRSDEGVRYFKELISRLSEE